MAHGIVENSGMAFVGDQVWHNKGIELADDSTSDEWKQAAGLDWEADIFPLYARIPQIKDDGVIYDYVKALNKQAIMRMDTGEMLGICTPTYKLVQPDEIVQFFHDLTKKYDMKLETMGCLFAGRRIFATARVGEGFRLADGDSVDPFLLIATSFDGSIATTGRFTTVRPVCSNTVSMALKGGSHIVKVRHSRDFNAEQVTIEMGILHETIDESNRIIKHFTEVDISEKQVERFIVNVFKGEIGIPIQEQPKGKRPMLAALESCYNSPGATMASAKGKVWGPINGITHYADHCAASRGDNKEAKRFVSAQFGLNSDLKDRAVKLGMAFADKGAMALTQK